MKIEDTRRLRAFVTMGLEMLENCPEREVEQERDRLIAWGMRTLEGIDEFEKAKREEIEINPNWYEGTCGESCGSCRHAVETQRELLDKLEKKLGSAFRVMMWQSGGHTMTVRVSFDGEPAARPESTYCLITESELGCFDEPCPDGPFCVGYYNDGTDSTDAEAMAFGADFERAVNFIRETLGCER